MIDLDQEIPNENLTQKDIMQFLLHSTQHVATRGELQDVKRELKEDINNLDKKIDKVEISLKQDISRVEVSLKQDISKVEDKISRVEVSLKQDISKVEDKVSKVEAKFDKIQWLIIATMFTVLFKDYLISLF